tara:strand:- start:26 stop:2482 length:2457 start_codon:yes stop_codon:yes gene_type:complete
MIFVVILLSTLFENFIYADDENSELEIITPDVIIDFEDGEYWYGLESGNTPYWKIEDGVGKFYLTPGILSPGERQLESVSVDLENILGEKIGEDWVLRYKITFDEFEQGSDSSWSQLLIGLFSKPSPENSPDITHGDANQWGLGAGFMTGADMTRTMLMYDLGFYLQWHSEPDKGEFERNKALPEPDKTIWLEYRKMKSFLTVSIFNNESYERETLIERQFTEGWANVDELRYLRIFPIIETNTADGIITGSIDDIEFYNNKRWVIKNFDEDELKELKTFEERLQELFDKQNKVNIDAEQMQLDQLQREKIPNWIKFPTGLWSDSFLTDDEFYRIIEYLIKNDVLAIPLSNYLSFDATFKPQTIKIPEDPECITCIERKTITLQWELPDDLALKGSNTQIFIKSPDQKTIRLTTSSIDYVNYEITSESLPGIYEIDVIYANEKFQAPSLLLTDNVIPQIPFWIKQDAKSWSNNDITSEQFKDVLNFLLKEKFIDLEPSDYISPESVPSLNDKQILLSYFPTELESKEFEPNTWKYFDSHARGIFQYRAEDSLLIETSVGKILYDISRPYDPIYNQNQVPYILMELYQYDSNEDARSFVDKYPRIYNEFFEQSDMSGTSDETGDCMYNNEKNITISSQDEIHMIICIYDNLALLITAYEDYTVIDSSLVFDVADSFFEKIHDEPVQKLEEILEQNFFETISETQDDVSESQSSHTQPSNPSEQIDPELSGAKVGIQNFSCIKDDFGFVEIYGEFSNDEKFYERVVFSIILKSYDGIKLAQGDSEILNVQPYEIRKFDGYVALDEPFYECNAIINWEKSG